MLEEGKLAPEVEQVLDMILPTEEVTKTDDDVFGIGTPQPVGAHWPIDAAVAAEDLQKAGFDIGPKQLAGHTKLVGVKMIENVECMEVQAQMSASDLSPPGIPKDATTEKGEVHASFSAIFPLDPGKNRVRDTTTMTGEFVIIQIVDGQPVRTELVMSQEKQSTYSEVVDGTPVSGGEPVSSIPVLDDMPVDFQEDLQALDRDNIRKVVHKQIGQVMKCNELAPLEDNLCNGRVSVRWFVGAKGEVTDALVAQTTLENAEIGECLVRSIRDWRFDPPQSKDTLEVTYPFHFTCAGY
ncbi:TonB family protein [Myxococcota bacterium]